MLSSTGSPLVGGGTASSMADTRTVRVLRPFFHANKLQAAGSVVELPAWVAAEVLTSHKAEPYTPPVQKPAQVEPVPEPKGKRNVGK